MLRNTFVRAAYRLVQSQSTAIKKMISAKTLITETSTALSSIPHINHFSTNAPKLQKDE